MSKKPNEVPEEFWINYISSAFVETLRWWVESGRKEDSETLSRYFSLITGIELKDF